MDIKWILFLCLVIFMLSATSCSYANKTNTLNYTYGTVSINDSPLDLKSNSNFNNSFNKVNSNSDNFSIYYGERIEIDGISDVKYNCTVFIDNKLVNFISNFSTTVNMYNYDSVMLNSFYPNVGLHNLSIIFEFDTPQKYDVKIDSFKKEHIPDYNKSMNHCLQFWFNVNDESTAKKRYSYNTTFNILKKKTVHIINISSFATYSNELLFNVMVDNPENSSFCFISNKTGVVADDSYRGYGLLGDMYDFDNLRYKINPGVYNLTIVNTYDNTFDTASFILYNDISINTTYKIKDNDVILNVEMWCEYNTPIQFRMNKLINETRYDYRVISKEILSNDNNHKFNFEICFNNVDNNDYWVDIWDYQNRIDEIYFTVNAFVDETEISGDIIDVNETGDVEKNVSNSYGNNAGVNGFGDNLNLKGNSTNSNSHKIFNVHNNDFREVINGCGGFTSKIDFISSENANSYEINEKSVSKSVNNMFSNLGIIILVLIAFMLGFFRFKRQY